MTRTDFVQTINNMYNIGLIGDSEASFSNEPSGSSESLYAKKRNEKITNFYGNPDIAKSYYAMSSNSQIEGATKNGCCFLGKCFPVKIHNRHILARAHYYELRTKNINKLLALIGQIIYFFKIENTSTSNVYLAINPSCSKTIIQNLKERYPESDSIRIHEYIKSINILLMSTIASENKKINKAKEKDNIIKDICKDAFSDSKVINVMIKEKKDVTEIYEAIMYSCRNINQRLENLKEKHVTLYEKQIDSILDDLNILLKIKFYNSHTKKIYENIVADLKKIISYFEGSPI